MDRRTLRREDEYRGDLEQREETGLLARGAAAIARLKSLTLLFIALLVFFLFVQVAIYVYVQPEYTAIAIVGPPNPSPISAMIAGLDGSGSLSSLSRKLMGGAGAAGAGNDPYQEYLQLLRSSRVTEELAQTDNLLPIVFYKKWDAEHKRWRPPGPLSQFVAAVERGLHLPAKEHPDADDLKKFLDDNLEVAQSTTGHGLSSLMGSDYMTVSFEFKDPREAELILNTILRRTDNIIRQERLRDVLARISYINSELPKVMAAEQRDSLIATLSNQEELRIMLVADERYAFTMVNPAHAPLKPTSPMSPIPASMLMVFLALVSWVAIAFFEPSSALIRRLTRVFEWQYWLGRRKETKRSYTPVHGAR